MSLRPHFDQHPLAHSPEIHHPRPTRPPELERRVTISATTEEQEVPGWRHYIPATAALNTETAAQSTEMPPAGTTRTRIQRSPSAPPAFNYAPAPSSTRIHPILDVRPIIRSRSRMRLTWDVRYSPDATTPSVRPNANHRYSTGALAATSNAPAPGRPRSNTQPVAGLAPDLELASDLSARLNHNYNSHPAQAETTSPWVESAFASHPVVLEPATRPPRPRMLIVCRDLLPWLIPVYARNAEVGCTVLDVIRGVHAALQTRVDVAGQMMSAERVERRRVDWLRDKTVFVCMGRDEALVRRRLPGRASLWNEVFVLTLARRER